MSRHSRTKLVPPKTGAQNQALETLEDFDPKQKEETVLAELENEIECPRCQEIMELQSSFDKLIYSCDGCSFMLKCV
jgi:phage FluMu protein Com